MALQPNGPAPYTTAISTTTAMTAWRDRGLGVPVTADVLTRAGVQETISPRTISSMKLLGLIDQDGKPTPEWEAMRQARGDDEYVARVQEWLRATYAEVLQYADPSTDTLQRVTEAFRTYEPSGQRKAMASLLVGLWRYAGLPVAEDDGSPRPSARQAIRKPGTPKPRTTPTRTKAQRRDDDTTTSTSGLPPALLGLLREVPTGGESWTTGTRDTFLKAFAAVLDFSVPVDDTDPESTIEDDDAEDDAE